MIRNVLLVAVAMLLIAGLASAQGTIVGSVHDFTVQPWTDGTICTPCHAPHNNQNAQGELLWNHDPSVATYSLYDSPTMNANQPADVASISKTCLSCHDGTVNVDAYNGGGNTTPIAGTANLGTDMSIHHPISISYCDQTGAGCTGVDGELNARTDAYGDFGGTIATYLFAATTIECASCHDVHNTETGTGAASLLYETNTASQVCLVCHAK